MTIELVKLLVPFSPDFWVSVAAAVFCGVMGLIAKRLWSYFSRAGSHSPTRTVTANRRNYTIIILSIIVGSFVIAISLFHAVMTTGGIVALALISLLGVSAHLVRELSVFWSIGFNFVSRSVSETTYRDGFDQVTNRFAMIGTNAYNFCDLPEFEKMVKRVRDSGGSARMLLAHPDSLGLKEAAFSRGLSETLYQEQGRYALGKLETLRRSLGVPLEIRLYEAECMADLPIFRIMFLNDSEAVAAVAVYGLPDHGKSLPQLYARRMESKEDCHRCMYSVLTRYFEGFWSRSDPIDGAGRIIYIQAMDAEIARRGSLLGQPA